MAAISTIIGAAALGLSAAGTYMSVSGASAAASANQQIAAAQMQQSAVQQKAATLDAKRRTLEDIRNAQKARSVALSNATTQNAQMGSGVEGGFGQVSGQLGTNLVGVQQNLELGRQYASLNDAISMQRMNLASAQSQSAFGSGLQSFGGTLISVMQPASRLGQSFFPSFGSFGSSGYGGDGRTSGFTGRGVY